MRLDSLKVKVDIKRLILALEDHKSNLNNKYKKELKDYENYAKKQSFKLVKEITDIAYQVEQLNFNSIKSGYRDEAQITLKCGLKSKPNKPNHEQIDSTIKALKLSSEGSIIIKQDDYNRLFSE